MHLKESTEIVLSEKFLIAASDNANSKIHSHPFFELVYVTRGRAEHIFEGRSTVVEAGDYFLINLDGSHGYSPVGGSADFRIINCMFLPEFIDPSLSGAKSFQDILNNYLLRFGYRRFSESPTRKIYRDRDGKMLHLVREMLEECDAKRDGYAEIIKYFLVSAIIYLVRNETSVKTPRAQDAVRTAKEYANNFYAEEIRLSDIAADTNFSPSHLSRLFTADTGIGFRDYLQKTRIEKSAALLLGTDKTVAEISAAVGYSDPAFFYRAFKKQTGTTPARYRKDGDQTKNT